MSKKALIAIGILIIVIAGGTFWLLRKDSSSTSPSSPSSSSSSSPSASNGTTAAATIIYSDSGYSPATITVHSGDTVTIKNTSSRSMQFDSDPHPVHTTNPELNIGSVPSGQSMTFTVDTKGTFGYHNHLNSTEKGAIVVE